MNETYLYGGVPVSVESAAGARGVIIRTLGGTLLFRVYHDRERFIDYEIRHDDLGVTIDAGELAAFYKVGARDVLDHSPEVLGLRKMELTGSKLARLKRRKLVTGAVESLVKAKAGRWRGPGILK